MKASKALKGRKKGTKRHLKKTPVESAKTLRAKWTFS
jgi:hypothetical protein